jgi:bisphosphoglycerate-independent phosphoglycerate mutase (AlkP superfamily)
MEALLRASRGRARVASVGGRYFGMDRDRRWERINKWYDSVTGVGPSTDDPLAAIQAAYARGETDEFITPMVVTEDGIPVAPMRDGDAVIAFNYRSDRVRQMVRALTQPDFSGFDVKARPQSLHLATMTSRSRSPGRLSAVLDGPHRGQGGLGSGHDDVPHGGNGEVPARDVFLQRGIGDPVRRRGA